jgi:hypothetical protein
MYPTGLIIDQPLGALPRPSPPRSWHRNGLQRRLEQLHFGRGRRFQEVPRGIPWPSTTTIHFVPLPRFVFRTPAHLFSRGLNCHPQRLQTNRAALGIELAQESPPGLQPHVVLFPLPQAPPAGTRRRIVFGKSFQRAPVRNVHRIPSKHGRLGMGLGPPQGTRGGFKKQRRDFFPLLIG